MSVEFTLHGSVILDIPSLYAELNRVFMADEDWVLGNSLDALDDLLHGGYGALHGQQDVTVVWEDMETSRAALGVAATLAWLQDKLDHPERFNSASLQAQRVALQQGCGQTYFDIVLEIFASHPGIHLQPA